MSIRDRLNRLTGETPSPPADRKKESIGELRKRIEEIIERRPAPDRNVRPEHRRPLEDFFPDSEEIRTPFGKIFAVHGRVHAGAFHGCKRPADLLDVDPHHASVLAGQSLPGGVDCRDALFLDTETTGLAGGTGTLAFLVGLGWYDGASFVTRQLFARDYGEEPALLSCLAELAREKRFLVTYNGKAFDINLLSTRFILNRMSDPVAAMPHLDLLHPSRRLVGYRLENSRLVTIEEKILGHFREGDVPGYEIPQRYFDWLRSRNPGLMVDVLEHNRLDVVSMAALLLHLCELLSRGTEAEGVCDSDVLAASRLFLNRGESGRAGDLLQVLTESEDAVCRSEACRELSLMHKRSGNWERATLIWERMLSEKPSNLFALLELAKWCEHRAGDFDRAAALVGRALEGEADAEIRTKLVHRLERIERRRRKKTAVSRQLREEKQI
jgi:uncharacterized protein YprB with RNaseH-like and TPR domain